MSDWARSKWQEALPPDVRLTRQQVALQVQSYYDRPVVLVLDGGLEVSGFLRSTTLNGSPDPEFPLDPVTVELRNSTPIALGRIIGVLPG